MWENGAVITVERKNPKEISVRIQDENEKMLADFLMGEYEAMCLIQSITAVLTKQDDDKYNIANLKNK
jgi:hypothetical protein